MKIIISGGGTAGHINPALAVAELLRERGDEVLFVGAEGKMEMERVPRAGFSIIGLPVVGIQRRLTLKNLAVPFKLLRSLSKAGNIIKNFEPDVVVGFGGYASAPIVRAAQKRGIKTVIQEQNSYAGLTNRALAKKAYRICVAYEGMERFFPAEKIVITGNPLRSVLTNLPSREQALKIFDLEPAKRTILVVGGSLGTRTLNEMVVQNEIPSNVQLIWQCGRYYYDEMVERAAHKIPLAYIERMDCAYSVADVVITRAGASTVSELQLIGKPTVFVPSPNVAEDHQTHNAMSLVKRGAAVLVKDSEAINSAMQMAVELADDTERCLEMAAAQRAMGRMDAASDVVKVISAQNYPNCLMPS